MRPSIPCGNCQGRAIFISENIYQAKYQCTKCKKLMYFNHPLSHEGAIYVCFNHQNKADMLIEALDDKFNYYRGNDPAIIPKFVLSDSDVLGRGGQMRRMKQRGTRKFFLYPHAARPSLANTIYPIWDGVTAQFVVNEYHAEVLRRSGYEKPLESMGWHLSPIEDFKSKKEVRKVLFAPIHPRNAPIDRKMNREAFNRLYKLVQAGEIDLTVRYIGLMEDNGMEPRPLVEYVNGKMDGTTSQMDSFDVVIAHQTFAWLAVARGVPTVMFAEDMPTHYRRKQDDYIDVPCWNDIKDLFRFPLDLLCESDTIGLLNRAVRSDEEIQDWKRRMIGDPFDREKFVETIERYL